MFLRVKLFKQDLGNCRVYYKGLGNQHGYLYCVQDGVWFFCSRDGEPESQLKDGLEITIYNSTDIIGNVTIKHHNEATQ